MGSEMLLANVREKVEETLQQVEKLKEAMEELPSSSSSSDPAAGIQSEICRRFILLDWMFKWEEEKPGRRSVKRKEMEILEELKDKVMSARIDAKASLRDLNDILIAPVMNKGPSGGKRPELKGREDSSYFPHYLELPGPVVRENILDYLTSPEDKLNLIKAVLSEGPLMRWQQKNLQFELVCQILMKRKDLDEDDLYSLSRVNEELRDLVKRNFESSLLLCVGDNTQKIDVEYLGLLYDVADGLQDERKQSKDERNAFLLNPLIGQVILSLRLYGDWEDDTFKKTMALLKRFGSKIWDFSLWLKYETPLLEKMKIISSTLRLLPNLRRFQVDSCSVHDDQLQHPSIQVLQLQWSLIDMVPLPDLPHLKTLELNGEFPGFEIVNRKLLDKFAKQLHCLVDHYEYPMLDYLEGTRQLEYSNLSTLKLFGSVMDDGRDCHYLERNIGYLTIFQNAPLKTIYLVLLDVDARARLPGLLTLLSAHFGQTLESLTLTLCPWNLEPEETRPPSPSTPSTWLFDLEFPKLKYFCIDEIVKGDGISYLLCFPALEKLEFKRIKSRFDLFENEPYLQLYNDEAEMLRSNVWKLLPSLEKYIYSGRLNITRGYCLWSQKYKHKLTKDYWHSDAFWESDWTDDENGND